MSEELLFRGVLLNALAKHTRRDFVALMISSIIYGLAYWNSTQTILYQLSFFLYGFVTGMIFGIGFLRTEKVLAGIFAHSILDTMIMTFVKFQSSNGPQQFGLVGFLRSCS